MRVGSFTWKGGKQPGIYTLVIFGFQQLCLHPAPFSPALSSGHLKGRMVFSDPLKTIRHFPKREVKTLAYTITPECINCGACDDSCPVGAISEAGDKRVISDECIDCGACVDTCPVGAIQG